MRLALLIGCFALTLGVAGCSKKSHSHAGDHPGKSMSGHMHSDSMDSADMHAAPKHGSSKVVTVTHKGSKIDPAVSPAQIPAGAWYCEMNSKVHFARLHKGDGKCPVCGMGLKKK